MSEERMLYVAEKETSHDVVEAAAGGRKTANYGLLQGLK